jgi:hypothetical protein
MLSIGVASLRKLRIQRESALDRGLHLKLKASPCHPEEETGLYKLFSMNY